MTYIILIAGEGTKLYPLTLNRSKTLYKLDSKTTVLQRMVKKIRQYDKNAEIIAVMGFMYEQIKKEIESENVVTIYNPFFAVTGSIASLWFARNYLERENVTIINGDMVFEDKLIEGIVCKDTLYPYVVIDSSVKNKEAYNVQINENRICVMSKELNNFIGKYVGTIKLDAISARLLKKKVNNMVNIGMYDQLLENVLVQMIFDDDFELYYEDISNKYKWTEIDCVDDLLIAKEIHLIK